MISIAATATATVFNIIGTSRRIENASKQIKNNFSFFLFLQIYSTYSTLIRLIQQLIQLIQLIQLLLTQDNAAMAGNVIWRIWRQVRLGAKDRLFF